MAIHWLRRFFLNTKKVAPVRPVQIFFTNTLSGEKELFISQKPGIALIYTCGPTVHSPAQIGNLRPVVFSDTLARTLGAAGYRVKRVINITDFGHLVSDGDEGEDKMTRGLKRDGLELSLQNMRTMAEKYAQMFLDDLAELNVNLDSITFPRASDYIPEQIALINTLEQKGYAYRTKNGVYFDTARFPHYGKLGGIDLDHQITGSRAKTNIEKRSATDFVLWKPDPHLGWESPWGRGFPGWHIECSAMSRSLLGQEIDIHTGGEDLAPVHHNNEIAQSEAASGRTFVHYWMHNAFLTVGGEKASKSLGNSAYLTDVISRGISPLALRYFFLQAHYRTPLSFSWEALEGAANALERLRRIVGDVARESRNKREPSGAHDLFLAHMRDDLGTPQALGVLWDTIRSDEYTAEEKWGLIEDAEAHFGLSLLDVPISTVALSDTPRSVQNMLTRREAARNSKNFQEADRIREELLKSGYRVDDGPNGPVLTKHAI